MIDMPSSTMKICTTTCPKIIVSMSFDRLLQINFNKILVGKFGCILEEIWIFEVGAFKSVKNHRIWNFHRIVSNIDGISNEDRHLQWWNFLQPPIQKYTKNTSFDEQSVVLFGNRFTIDFGNVLEEIWICEVCAFKSIEIQEICNFHRILSNIDWISQEERNLQWWNFLQPHIQKLRKIYHSMNN